MEHQIRPEDITLPPTQPLDLTSWLVRTPGTLERERRDRPQQRRPDTATEEPNGQGTLRR